MKYLLCGINAKYIHSNLAIFCLKSYAEKYGTPTASIEIKEYTINHYVEDILQDLYMEKADVVIFSCYIWNISFVRELAAELKKVSPHLKIWVGGPEVSYASEEFLRNNPAVDLVMLGDGEQVFTALTTQMENGDRMERKENMPAGVSWRIKGGEIASTGFAPVMDLDLLPFVYEDFRLFAHKIIYYETSRGCPFSCSYCLSSVEKRVRLRSLDKVLPELQRFLEAKVPQVKFVDRTFNCNKAHAMAIWRYIHEHDNQVTNFHFEIAADLLDEEAMELFAQMRPGLIQLEIGVQSTHQETIREICRRSDEEKVFAHVDRIHAMGNIHQHLDLIAGLPGESYAQFKQSFNDLFLHEPDELQLGFLKVLKGTVMEQKAQEYGLVYRSEPPYEVLSTKWISYEELIWLKGIEELVEMYYNSGQFTATLRYVIPSFACPFTFFSQFSLSYRSKGCHKMNHTRLGKYENLRNFLKGQGKDLPFLDEIMLLDMYRREKMKARPVWADDLPLRRKEMKDLYRSRGNELFPQEWEENNYDSKKAANHSHMEAFSFDVEKFLQDGIVQKKPCWCLFDYNRRSPLDKNARICVIAR